MLSGARFRRHGASRYRDAQAVVIGVDETDAPPAVDAEDFDVLISTAANAPRPWIAAPGARAGARLSFDEALTLDWGLVREVCTPP